ncbi:MAG: needle chaperone SctE [Oceanospirillaceae bacterium]|nr:needle chaperone SctE [Oceanospirillaceae bacterium]
MFGLGDKNKNEQDDTVFDLEKDLQNSNERREIQQQIKTRMLEIKNLLRGGLDKSEFNDLGHVLHGYAALLKVVARFNPKT